MLQRLSANRRERVSGHRDISRDKPGFRECWTLLKTKTRHPSVAHAQAAMASCELRLAPHHVLHVTSQEYTSDMQGMMWGEPELVTWH